MISLTWPHVNAWRLSRHHLSPRLERRDFLDAAGLTCGIQAQVMSAAEMALWARADGLTPQDVRSALWQDRTLVKTWAMRGTLHLLTAADLPLYVAARSVHEARNWLKYFTFFGMTPEQYEAVIVAIPQVLGNQPLTRQQLAAAVAQNLGIPKLGEHLQASSWGSLWKPSAWRGDLCFGPSQGQNVTFVNPQHWLDSWQPVEPYPALQEIARRYLRAFGPATPKEFALWWGFGMLPSRELFRSLEAELEPVDVEGWQALVLRQDLQALQRSELRGSVNLLPFFDAYVLGIGRGRAIEALLPQVLQKEVYRPQGWISAVVLVDGYIQGIWEYKDRGSQTLITVDMFSPVSKAVRRQLQAEADRLSVFWDTKVDLKVEIR